MLPHDSDTTYLSWGIRRQGGGKRPFSRSFLRRTCHGTLSCCGTATRKILSAERHRKRVARMRQKAWRMGTAGVSGVNRSSVRHEGKRPDDDTALRGVCPDRFLTTGAMAAGGSACCCGRTAGG